MKKFVLIFVLYFTAFFSFYAQQQNITEINWTTTPRMETKAIANQTTATLFLTTNLPNSDVYLNYNYVGKTPLSLRNLDQGIYRLQLKKEGYFEREFYLTLNSGTENNVYVELLPATGYLSIQTNPRNAQILIDGKKEAGNDFELLEGVYRIEVTAFGYQTYSVTVNILRSQKKEFSVELQKADFSIFGLILANKKFNPNNPSNLGKLTVDFSVTAAGQGSIRIIDEVKQTVFTDVLPLFTTWQQSYVWNGKDMRGKIVSDGIYTIEIHAEGADKKEVVETAFAVVDSSIYYPLQALTLNGGSFGANPSPFLFPQNAKYMTLKALSVFNTQSGFVSAPISFGFLYAPLSWFETSVQMGIHIDGTKPLPLLGGVSLKFGNNISNFYYTGYIRYALASAPILFALSGTGFAGGTALGCKLGIVMIGTHAEYIIGEESGFFVPFTQSWNAGLALQIQKDIFGASIWIKWLSSSNLQTGIDTHFLLPASNVLVNMQIASQFPQAQKPIQIIAGFGLGFLF